MRSLISGIFLAALLLVGCEQRPAATEAAPAAPASVAARAVMRALPHHPADTLDVSQRYYAGDYGPTPTDTLVRLAGRTYRLLLQAQTDSTRPLGSLTYRSLGAASPVTDSLMANGADSSAAAVGAERRFFDAHYRITLLDSTGHRQFQYAFTKRSLYSLLGSELGMRAIAATPEYLGYNAPRGLLLFRLQCIADETDWGSEVLLALGRDGRVRQRQITNAYGGSGADCRIQQSPDGRAVLTCRELWLPDGRQLSLQHKNGDLVAARFLSDTTLLTVYDYVTTKLVKTTTGPEYQQMPIARLRHAPNAFVRSATTGHTLVSFRYEGYYDALNYAVPRRYVWQTQTYYLLDAGRRILRVIPKLHPRQTREVSLSQLQSFAPPRHPHEIRFSLNSELGNNNFYLDTLSHQLRYQPLPAE